MTEKDSGEDAIIKCLGRYDPYSFLVQFNRPIPLETAVNTLSGQYSAFSGSSAHNEKSPTPHVKRKRDYYTIIQTDNTEHLLEVIIGENKPESRMFDIEKLPSSDVNLEGFYNFLKKDIPDR